MNYHDAWVSGPLPFSDAAAVWAAAAGIAGAYFPDEFARLAGIYHVSPGQWCLPALCEEATRRARWRARFDGAAEAGVPFGRPAGSFVEPRAADIVCGRLEWMTSVVTALYPHPEQGWEVAIEGGVHRERQAAAEAAIAALGGRPK